MPEPRSGERALRSKFMLIFRGGAVARHDLSPSELQAHVEVGDRLGHEGPRSGRGGGEHRHAVADVIFAFSLLRTRICGLASRFVRPSV